MLVRTRRHFDEPTAAWQKIASKFAGIVVLAILLPPNMQKAAAAAVAPPDQAAIAFARYTGGMAEAQPWTLETIDIEASLPSMEKRGRLRAIRRLLPKGKPEYRVLEIGGDQTVRQEVIVRYLTAQAQSASIPPSSVAITPANYKFSYKCAVNTVGNTAYAFLITPRKKRTGLIKGELWLDGQTGAVVRQSGYLVKSPSIFIKRITVTRDTTLRNGLAQERVTHLSVETRIVGRAELTIHERPCSDSDSVAGNGQ
jgi:hypothetical protein